MAKKTGNSKALWLSNAHLVPWEDVAPRSVLPLEKGSKAGVVMDQSGTPRLFVFDTHALLDILSAIDERLVDRLSSEDYHSKAVNPAGWLIDEIETRLPVNERYAQSLRDVIHEAKKRGWIPFETIARELKLTE